jgi:N-acetylneuraminate synthase
MNRSWVFEAPSRRLGNTRVGAGQPVHFVERQITLDRTLWGPDLAASSEPQGPQRLARDIRVISEATGDGVKRVYDGERSAMKKLRQDALAEIS